AGPFPKGGTSKSPFIKGEPACQRLARNGATVPAHTAMAGRFRGIFVLSHFRVFVVDPFHNSRCTISEKKIENGL
ncbi:MAG: hypothetical protein KAU38_11025, partial [Desulfobacterales bacterium]|nr:hypothetical protein [Desulfobacterales bacterium]